MRKMAKSKQIACYVLLVFMATVVFLYVLFPSQRVKAVLTQRLSENLPPSITVSIERLSPRFPPGLILHSIVVQRGEKDIAELDRFIVTPDLWGLLFTNENGFTYKGEAFSGTFSGEVNHGNKSDAGLLLNLDFSGLRLEKIASLQDLFEGKLTGIAEGTVTYNENGDGRSGKGDLRIVKGMISLERSLCGFTAVHIQDLQATFRLDQDKLKISKVDFSSNKLTGNASGHIRLADQIARSIVDLTANIRLRPSFMKKGSLKTVPEELVTESGTNKGIKFKITGPLASPMVH